jgi:hypothetical protein
MQFLQAGINPAPTNSRLIDLVGAGFMPARAPNQRPVASNQPVQNHSIS